MTINYDILFSFPYEIISLIASKDIKTLINIEAEALHRNYHDIVNELEYTRATMIYDYDICFKYIIRFGDILKHVYNDIFEKMTFQKKIRTLFDIGEIERAKNLFDKLVSGEAIYCYIKEKYKNEIFKANIELGEIDDIKEKQFIIYKVDELTSHRGNSIEYEKLLLSRMKDKYTHFYGILPDENWMEQYVIDLENFMFSAEDAYVFFQYPDIVEKYAHIVCFRNTSIENIESIIDLFDYQYQLEPIRRYLRMCVNYAEDPELMIKDIAYEIFGVEL